MRMLKILTVAGFVILIMLLFQNTAREQAPTYNVGTETKIEGVVQDIHQFWCPISGDEGTHLLVKTEARTLEVHVAPYRFLMGDNMSFNKGDQIAVIGSMVTYESHDALIARQINRGDQTFAFREADGKPLWMEHLRTYAR